MANTILEGIWITQCTVLGGASYPITAGDIIEFQFGVHSVEITRDKIILISIPYIEIVEISLSGPGLVTTGGGFIGGGFGIAGALKGIAIATILNALTTRTKIHTFISIITNIGELHCHYGGMEPSALRVELSEVFTALRQQDPVWIKSRLDALEIKHAAKNISDSELETFKHRLLNRVATIEWEKREHVREVEFAKLSEEQRNYERLPKGNCPMCNSIIPMSLLKYPKCGAMFGKDSAWSIIPLGSK